MNNGEASPDDPPLDPILESDDVLRGLIDYDEALAAGLTDSITVDQTFQRLEPLARQRVAEVREILDLLNEARRPERAVYFGSRPSLVDRRAEQQSDGVVGRTLGGFRIEAELGRGGHGVVFLAYDAALDRKVALKIPRPETLLSASARARFIAEGRAVASLDHPHIVKVFEAGETAGVCYIASEFCSGPNLNQWLREHVGTITPRNAAHLVADLADAVEHAHARGILHRDLKPANVLLQPIGGNVPFAARLADFGIAKVFDDPEDHTRTMTGTILGSPNYMSPEQAAGKASQVGAPSDVYGLGAVLYELLTGKPPFDGETRAAVIQRVLSDEPTRPRSINGRIPRELDAVCLKCLEKKPESRYRTAADLRDDLKRYLNGVPIAARPYTRIDRAVRWCRRRPASAGLLLLTFVSLVGFSVGGWWHSLRLQQEVKAVQRERERAIAGEADAQAQRIEADQQRAAVEERERRLRRDLFSLDAHTAFRAVTAGGSGDADDILRKYEGDPAITSGFVWRYLWRLAHLADRVWSEPGKQCNSVVFSPDGARLAAGIENGLAPIWDVATGKELLRLHGHTSCVNTLRFTLDGARLITASCDGTVRIWNAASGKEERVVLRQTRPILSLALHPDGVLAACGDDEGCVRIVHVGQGKMLASRHIGRGRIDDLSFSNDGKWLAVAASDDLHICNAADLGLTKTSEGRGHQPMASTAFSPNSRVLARAGREGLIYIGDVLKTGAEPPIHTVGPNIRTCTFDPDGRHLLCGGDSRVIEVWDISTRQRVGQYYGHKERVAGLSVSPNGSLLASASFDGTVRLWSMEKPTNSKLLLAAPGADHVEFAARGSLLLVGSSGDLRSFETHRWQQKARVPADCFEVATGAVGGFVVTWYQSKGTVRQIDTLKEVWSFNPEAFRPQSLAGLLLSADGRQVTLKVQPLMNVAGVGSQGRLYRYDAPNSNVTAEVYRASGAFVSFAVSPRTSHIVLSNSDSTDLIDIPGTGKNESRIRSSAGLIRQLSFNSDGSLFAAASEDRSVYVWQADTYKLRAALIGHEASVNCVAFAPDGMTLASGDDSGIVRFWDLQTKHEILRLQAHSLPVKSVAFSSDGRLLATATARLPDKSGEVKIWFAGPPTISSGGSSATVSAVK